MCGNEKEREGKKEREIKERKTQEREEERRTTNVPRSKVI